MKEINELDVEMIFFKQKKVYQQIPIGTPKRENYTSKSPSPDSVNLVHNENQEG